jgi:cystathionine beta-lyase/cystathionine gamma-synthase
MIDFSDLKKVSAAIQKNTKIVWIESPTNPTLKCTDIEAVAKICKAKGAMLVIDNTFMSPVLQNPLLLGADIVMHSHYKTFIKKVSPNTSVDTVMLSQEL